MDRTEDGKVIFNYSDMKSIPEWPEGPMVEIIQGELYMAPSPQIKHLRISRNLEFIIHNYTREHNLGEVLNAPIDVVLSDENVVIPDIIFILEKNKEIIGDKNIKGIPDLIVEILSSNVKLDKVTKKELYEKFKVPEYWIIDPITETISVYLFSGNKFILRNYKKGEIISIKTIKGLEVDTTNIFKY